MPDPAWPGTAGKPALGSRALHSRKSLQLPFATAAVPTETDAPEILWGTGSPDGVLSGDIGDSYHQQDGVAPRVLWVKTTAAPATTGWRRVATLDTGANLDQSAGGFRFTVDGFNQENVPISQTNVELVRATGRWRATRVGSVVGLVITTTEARIGGTCTIKVFKNSALAGVTGIQLGSSTVALDATRPTGHALVIPIDSLIFAALDEVYLTVTTDAAWSPTTADIRCAMDVET